MPLLSQTQTDSNSIDIVQFQNNQLSSQLSTSDCILPLSLNVSPAALTPPSQKSSSSLSVSSPSRSAMLSPASSSSASSNAGNLNESSPKSPSCSATAARSSSASSTSSSPVSPSPSPIDEHPSQQSLNSNKQESLLTSSNGPAKKVSSFSITDLLSNSESKANAKGASLASTASNHLLQFMINNANSELLQQKNAPGLDERNKFHRKSPFAQVQPSKKIKTEKNHASPLTPPPSSKKQPQPSVALGNNLTQFPPAFGLSNLPMDMYTAEKLFQQIHQQQQQAFPMFMSNPSATPSFEQFLLHQQQMSSLLGAGNVGHNHMVAPLPPPPPLISNEFLFNSIEAQKKLNEFNCKLDLELFLLKSLNKK